MLKEVRLPYGKTVRFEYDALGRRTAKLFNGHVFRYLWDGNVMVQEWQYEEKDRPQHSIDEFGRIRMQGEELVENLVTWVYEEGSYVPVAKIHNGERYTIISDYMGRPVEAYNSYGNVVWQADYDIYGDLRSIKGIRDFIPFRQLGQYEDDETHLYYNRFRYYDPRIGNYISQDPIRLMGNNPNVYAYVHDVNRNIDLFGLDELYALVASKDGWFPVFEYGKKAPVGEMYLKKGELWKIGTSKNASKRYTQKYLRNIGVDMKVLHTNISRKTTLFLENLKLRGYLAWKGHLPAGNKCKH